MKPNLPNSPTPKKHAASKPHATPTPLKSFQLLKLPTKVALAGFGLTMLTGCVILGDKLDHLRWNLTTLPFYVFDNAPVYHKPESGPVMDDTVNFAIAISGGGSRSALFSAGILEQLAYLPDPNNSGRSVLEACDSISAVSGGSLSAAYYGLFKPRDFSDPKCTEEFFQRYKSNMTTNFTGRSFVHYISHPWEAAMKYYTRQRFAQTLANTFDQYIFQGATFEHLHEREVCGESPHILLNATSLDNGKKFVFSNLSICDHMTVDPERLVNRLPGLVPPGDVAPLGLLGQVAASPIYSSFGFDSIDSDIIPFRIANAVAASSAYPVLPGDYSLINYATNGYVHLGDGGINDNFGIDSLISLYLNKLQDSRKGRRLVVLSINAGLPLEEKRAGDPDGYQSAIEYGERASIVLATRGQTMATALYNSSSSVQVISINLGEAMACKNLFGKNASYAITEEDMHVVLQAAAELIQAKREQILSTLGGRG